MYRLDIVETSERTEQETSCLDRTAYLLPTRYFHFYLFRERSTQGTCWLPEGFTQ
jgi:hypothetical protein